MVIGKSLIMNNRTSVRLLNIHAVLVLLLMIINNVQAVITPGNNSTATATNTSSLNTITFVGTGALAERQNCGTLTPAIPGGATDDLLIASIAARNTGTNIAIPTGWTLFGESTYAGQALKSFLYYRVATGADAVTFTLTGSCSSSGARVVRFSGVDTADPIEPLPIPYGTVDANVTQSNSGNITTGSITTSLATAMVVISTYINDNRRVSEVGYSQSFDDSRNVNQNYSHGLFYQLQTTIGSKSVTGWDLQGNGSDENIDFIYALKPGTTSTNPTGITIAVPAGAAIGDFMIATIAVTSTDTVTESGTSDWTLENSINHSDSRSRQLVYSRVVDGSEPANYTWAFGAIVTDAVAGIINYSGVDTSNPIDLIAGNETPSSLSYMANEITTTVADAMVISTHGFTSSENWTIPPAGMTERVNISSRIPSDSEGISLEMNEVLQAVAGPTGNKTATAGGNADTGIAHLLALRPFVVTTATVSSAAIGGSAISADTNSSSGNGTYTSLTGPVIQETSDGGMLTGAYTLTAPSGFEFNTSSNSVSITMGTVSGTGTSIDLGAGPGNAVTVTPTTVRRRNLLDKKLSDLRDTLVHQWVM